MYVCGLSLLSTPTPFSPRFDILVVLLCVGWEPVKSPFRKKTSHAERSTTAIIIWYIRDVKVQYIETLLQYCIEPEST